MYTIKDCTDEELYKTNFTNRYLILKEDFFKPEFRDEKFQIVLAMSGFGCDPSKVGNAIYVKEICANPEYYRIERCDNHILGIAKDSVVKQHLKKYS